MTLRLFHIATADDWAAREAHYLPAAFAADGFIHCCTAQQLAGVAARYFRGRGSLVLLTIDAARVEADIRWENTAGGSERFPHLYGSLNVDAVSGCRAASVAGDGRLMDAHAEDAAPDRLPGQP